jgi:hypothetical protein
MWGEESVGSYRQIRRKLIIEIYGKGPISLYHCDHLPHNLPTHFDSEYGGVMFLLNVDIHLPNYTV